MKRKKYYKKIITRINNRIEYLNKISKRYSTIRLIIFGVGFAFTVFGLYFGSNFISGIAIFLLFILFPIVGIMHGRIHKSINKTQIWLDIKKEHLARLTLNWNEIPASQAETPNNHPFAIDIDICGEYSLFRLLNNTSSRQSGQTLLNWLLKEKPDPEATKHRQAIVRELTNLTNFRDKLNLKTQLVSKDAYKGEALQNWLLKESRKKTP